MVSSITTHKKTVKSRLLNLDYDNIDTNNRRSLAILGDDERTQVTTKTSYPIGLFIGGGRYCSATLISKRVILTSAHCIYDRVNERERATKFYFYPNVISAADINQNNTYEVVEWHYSEDYINAPQVSSQNFGPETTHDIAVARLNTSTKGEFDNWMHFGYDTTLSAPQTMETAGYPGDKTWATEWYQSCNWNIINDHIFQSTETQGGTCDQFTGQSGSAVYKSVDNNKIIYAVIKGEGSASEPNYGRWNVAAAIDKLTFYWICGFISKGEDELPGCNLELESIKQHTYDQMESS